MKRKLILILPLISLFFLSLQNITLANIDLGDIFKELQDTWGGVSTESQWDEEINWDLIINSEYEITTKNQGDLNRNILVLEGGVLSIWEAIIVSWDITVNTWTLIIAESANISWNIILNHASYVEIGDSVNIWNLTGTSDILIVWSKSKIDTLYLIVTEDTLFQDEMTINNIHLKTKNLNIGSNSNLWTWVIYTYENFNIKTNWNFQGKLTIFQNFTMDKTNNFKWNLCILDNISIWKSPNIDSYNHEWLYGNIYPILIYNISDELSSVAKEIAESFDKELILAIKKMDYYNWKILELESTEGLEEIKTKKEQVKSGFINTIDNTFEEIQTYIDNNEKSENLLEKIKTNYKLAIEWESVGQLSQVCNNSNSSFDIDSMYVEWKDIIFKDSKKKMKRYTVLSEKNINTVLSLAGKLPLKRLAKVNSKIEAILPILAENNKEKTINIILDIRDILRDIILYQ